MGGVTNTMDSIVILDDDEAEEPSTSTLRLQRFRGSTPSKDQELKPTHITQSPFSTAKKEGHVLKVENEKLFGEFLEHCMAHTKEHPEVVTFLQTKYSKASPDFLMSVEFRNALGRCLTRAQASTTKTFVYINELCTLLKQHSAKRRALIQPSSPKESKGKEEKGNIEETDPSTGKQPEEVEVQRKTKKASRRQIAYLENLLKVYNDEIKRLQERELGLDDLEKEDSSYVQEHKLKRKMMKIYDKLCELKGCTTMTGRVIEQRITYSGTRYPELNKKIERFINKPESQQNPPDYGDILQVVKRANERYSLTLSRKQLLQIAQEAFRETGNRLQERRHLDMVYNFGSHLTDLYKPTTDPALSNPSLSQKLRSNREVALTSLEEVINKYAYKQDDTEEKERQKRQEKERQKKQQVAAKAQEDEKDNVQEQEKEEEDEGEGEEPEEEEEEDEEEDEVSSDPDIEEEIQASEAQVGPDDDEDEDQLNNGDNEQPGIDESSQSVRLSGQDEDDVEGGDKDLKPDTDACGSNEMETNKKNNDFSPIESLSTSESPSQSEAVKLASPENNSASHNHKTSASESIGDLAEIVSTNENSVRQLTTISASCSPFPPSPEVIDTMCNSKKRKRESKTKHTTVRNGNIRRNSESDCDISLDMGVINCSPVRADSTRADTPTQDMVSSSRSTPPPKKNKVNVATQCDPEEVIVLSDSD
ncbi:death domain-associated protein 6 isoform X1 [Astyanax mexicanus]|uniref:death domain-associated protein 6 isoform X1 n=2 Tax=Astyanax mexicanus TaxID=7994 RepID=UPI0020CAA7B7|nr:death domain-associated protein 6 isoform X1 [Astyanax mexicanus]